MKKQIIFIHGGEHFDTREEYLNFLRERDYDPYEQHGKGWKQYVAEQLQDDFDVIMPSMPCKKNAKYDEWGTWFDKLLPHMRDNLILIGNSLGGHFIAQYLQEYTLPVKIAQLHLVAGCICPGGGFTPLTSLSNVEKQTDQIFIYHSHDDPIVPFSAAQAYKKILPSAELIEFDDRGHFFVEEFPELVAKIKK